MPLHMHLATHVHKMAAMH